MFHCKPFARHRGIYLYPKLPRSAADVKIRIQHVGVLLCLHTYIITKKSQNSITSISLLLSGQKIPQKAGKFFRK